jgi:carbon storage regulator
MLVLSRKKSEQIVIGEEIRVTVVKIDRSTVRIGIEAPPEMPIVRQELVAAAAKTPDARAASAHRQPARVVN